MENLTAHDYPEDNRPALQRSHESELFDLRVHVENLNEWTENSIANRTEEIYARIELVGTELRNDARRSWITNGSSRSHAEVIPPILELLLAQGVKRSDFPEAIRHSLAYRSERGFVGERIVSQLDDSSIINLVESDRNVIPLPIDREGYCPNNHIEYWSSGLGEAQLIADQVALHAQVEVDRFLDFGCASGRVLRHFSCLRPHWRLFGADIGIPNVAWARQHLHPGINIFQVTTVPHLPLGDASLGAVYAGSVFTHIDAFEESTLLEIHRALRTGGIALLSILPERGWRDLSDPRAHLHSLIRKNPFRIGAEGSPNIDPERDLIGPMPGDRVVLTQTNYPVYNTHVFHSDEWIRNRWLRDFELVTKIEGAHNESQDLLVLRKR